MARPLRIEIPGGRYHVTSRGNERRAIYRDHRDREHFVELLAELPERFGVALQGYVLLDNHYHLLIETPEGGLSRAVQWLNVSYSVWFNRRHRRSGHLFQGRFASILVEDQAGWAEVGRYVHLNPVRVARLGLDKRHRRASRRGGGEAPTVALVSERLRILREWRWSSYRAAIGLAPRPSWLACDRLAALCGGRTEAEQQKALREYTEQMIREGVMEGPWERLLGGVVLGSEAYARRVGQVSGANAREQTAARLLGTRVEWGRIVAAVAKAKGESWEEFCGRHGDWGRDAALWLGRRVGRLRLRELAALAGGMDYTAAGKAVSRFGQRLAKEPALRRRLDAIQTQLSNVEM